MAWYLGMIMGWVFSGISPTWTLIEWVRVVANRVKMSLGREKKKIHVMGSGSNGVLVLNTRPPTRPLS